MAACNSLKAKMDANIGDGQSCTESLSRVRKKTDIGGLNLVRQMYHNACYQEVIAAAQYIRAQFRDQTISLTRDLSEVVFYEGTFVDYQMESYERTYLTILVALAYYKQNQIPAVEVELRKAYEESTAVLETKGQDRITLLMMALLWENIGKPEMARPLFKRIIELSGPKVDPIYNLARELHDIPRQGRPQWQITELSNLPEMNVTSQSSVEFRYPEYQTTDADGKKSFDYTYYKIRNCTESSTQILATDDWLKFLNDRIQFPSNVKSNIKKMARLPLTLLYTTVVFSAGAAITVELAKSCKSKDCGELIFYTAAATVAATNHTLNAGLVPDTRYWNGLPQAIGITNGNSKDKITNHTIYFKKLNCLNKYSSQPWFKPHQLL